MALWQRHFLPLELTMSSNLIIANTLGVPLGTEAIRDGCAQTYGRLISEAYAQT